MNSSKIGFFDVNNLIFSHSRTVTEKDKGFTLAIQKKLNARFVRQAFTHWAQMTRKSQDAKRLYMERLLPK